MWWMLQRERAAQQPAGLVGCYQPGGCSSSDDEQDEQDEQEQGAAGSTPGNKSGDDVEAGSQGAADGSAGTLHPLWRRVRALPGGFAVRFFLNPFSGLVTQQRFEAPPPVRGELPAAADSRSQLTHLLSCMHRCTLCWF